MDTIAPLHAFMEGVYNRTEKPTSGSVSRIDLCNVGLRPTESAAFKNAKIALAYQVTLVHRVESRRL